MGGERAVGVLPSTELQSGPLSTRRAIWERRYEGVLALLDRLPRKQQTGNQTLDAKAVRATLRASARFEKRRAARVARAGVAGSAAN